MAFSRLAHRMMRRVTAAGLLVTAFASGVTVSAAPASAAGTALFNQPFHDNTVDGPAGSVTLPATPTKTNVACLSAAGNATANPLASCPAPTDPQGSGKLRLTSSGTALEGGIFASTSVPTSQGLDVTFNSYQYGGSFGADGMAFVLAAVDPANPATPSVMGQSGGSLGYSAENSNVPGLSHGYLGVGLDAFGNYSNKFEGTGCTDPANIAQRMPGQVVVRGPGNGTVGYCALKSSAATATSPALTLRAATRAASVVPVEVVYNPSSSPVTTASGLTVPAGDYDVTFTPVGGPARSLVGALPTVPAGLYPASWVNASGFPKQVAFGWVASTGSNTDYHEIDNALVSTLNPVPQLAVSQTSYTVAPLAAGSPVTYTVAASSSGAAENSPVTVTETLPGGVLPVGASGTGWVCGAPAGQQISCTNSSSPFTSGTVTVNGVVNSGSVTPALVQSSTSAVASSADANPAMSTSAPAGTVPAAPNVTSITPASGAAGGGGDVIVHGSNLSGATAIQIGTTAEFAAGTPTTLNLCSSAAPGCFTVVGADSLDIPAMPGHAAGAVRVQVVSLGSAGTGTYTYNTGPALLFAPPPGGEVGAAYSDQLTVTGGTSPFTWSVSAGTLPPGMILGATSGLLSGTPTTAGSYSFTVKVTDHAGLSDAEPVILSVVAGPSLAFPAPPAGWTNTVYGDTLSVSGGTGPFAWSVSSGALPAGLSLSADGNLSGTPTAVGVASFTVQVTDANGQSATQATSITISAGVSATFPAPPAAVLGTAYSDTLTATGGTTPYTWSVNAGGLPPGITLTSAGVLAGTPTAAGSYPFSVNVIDKNGGIATTPITLVVSASQPGALSIVQSTDVATTTPGSTVHYTIKVSNTGAVSLTGAAFTDPLSGILDDASYGSDASATAGTVSFASPNLTWTGNLAAGAAATITYSVKVNNPDTGDRILASTITSATPGSTCPSGNASPGCTVAVAVLAGALTMTAPASTTLGSAAPGGTIRAGLGSVQVTDNRGFGASWTATVSATAFTTGGGTAAETIPAADAVYDISALSQTTGPATFASVPATTLTAAPQAVVTATNVGGNTFAAWTPVIVVSVPPTAVAGAYAATITHSVS